MPRFVNRSNINRRRLRQRNIQRRNNTQTYNCITFIFIYIMFFFIFRDIKNFFIIHILFVIFGISCCYSISYLERDSNDSEQNNQNHILNAEIVHEPTIQIPDAHSELIYNLHIDQVYSDELYDNVTVTAIPVHSLQIPQQNIPYHIDD